MQENNDVIFKAGLDVKDFASGALQAKGLLKDLGETENLEGLLGVVKSLGVTFGVVATSVLAAKTAIDLTLEAEQIKRINEQFELMTKASGIATETLRKGLEKATAGLAMEDEVLKVANERIVAMGASAAKLPEIMDMARKATKVFGGDLLDNFDQMSLAIANQQVRSLKHFGIIVDQTKAYKDYAKSIGVSANELSEQGKQQAFLEAALAKGKKGLKDISISNESLSETFSKMKVTIKEAYETIAIAFEKAFGSKIRNDMKIFGETLGWVANIIKEKLSGERGVTAFADISNEIRLLNLAIDEETKKLDSQSLVVIRNAAAQIAAYKAQREEKQKELNSMTEVVPEKEKEAPVDIKVMTDDEQIKKDKTKFYSELLSLRSQHLAELEKMEWDSADVERNIVSKKKIIFEELSLKKQEIDIQYSNNKTMAEQLKDEADRIANEKVIEAGTDKNKRILEANERRASAEKGMGKQLSDGFINEAKRQANAANDFSKVGAQAFNSVKNNAVDALKAWGAGTQTASEAMKSFFLKSLADMAAMQGEVMMLAAFATGFNGAKFAAGAGLVALSGTISAMAGGGGKSSTSGVSGGAGVGSSTDPIADAQLSQSQMQKKSVSIEIHGSYFETEQTRQKLMDIIRESTDQSDFNYFQVKA